VLGIVPRWRVLTRRIGLFLGCVAVPVYRQRFWHCRVSVAVDRCPHVLGWLYSYEQVLWCRVASVDSRSLPCPRHDLLVLCARVLAHVNGHVLALDIVVDVVPVLSWARRFLPFAIYAPVNLHHVPAGPDVRSYVRAHACYRAFRCFQIPVMGGYSLLAIPDVDYHL